MNQAATFHDDTGSNALAFAGMGPVGLYYFFSPSDESVAKDVAVLNKIWREGRLGVVGIPVGGKYEDVGWARLLKRVFDIDIEHCPNCGGALKIIAAIEDPPVILRILARLGLPTRAPPRSRARRFDLF